LIQNGSRLPGAPPKLTHWLQNFIRAVDNRKHLLSVIDPAIQALKDLIESKADLRMLASAMFDEVPNKNPYQNSIELNHVRGYQHMLELFNVIVAEIAPTWSMAEDGLGLIGLPFQAILDWPMGTPSGHAFFLREDVNRIFKVILDTWRDRVLKTSSSKCVVTTDDGGWLCKDSLAAFEKDANLDIHRWYRFQDLFECDPETDPVHWGFQSWDDFSLGSLRISTIYALLPIQRDRSGWLMRSSPSQSQLSLISKNMTDSGSRVRITLSLRCWIITNSQTNSSAARCINLY
jgi:phosphatidylserine decarboxylase